VSSPGCTVLAASVNTATLMDLVETPRTLELPPGPGPQIWPTPGHMPLPEPDARSAAEATELPASDTVEISITVLAAAVHHQDILRNINTLPIALGARERPPTQKA
jgi:hypothetical protein